MKISSFSADKAGTLLTPLRWVIGWTYFSALWRRLILADKLDPEAMGYIGEKFNHFLPNALFIKPIIEYLLTHPDLLWINMVVFTIIEGIVGLAVIFGFASRLMGLAVTGLALGILLGAGWLGSTCLDEWQIGVLGIVAGFAIFLGGGGHYSLDRKLAEHFPDLANQRWFRLCFSGDVSQLFPTIKFQWLVLLLSAAGLFITLFTNQVFHGGLWGTLHNKSVRPHLTLSGLQYAKGQVQFTVIRDEGIDVYGSFVIGMEITDQEGQQVAYYDQQALSGFATSDIANYYIAKIKPSAHSLVVPLGAKADIVLRHPELKALPKGTYTLKLLDISGASWTEKFIVD
ncbi:TQO small subunit DoxD [Rapidithrix thailandica]|uniref:TQO small subunit DoxD n=1 Tax=Rapidithrix thailandica TaxID=413964 RepID=A0AAW9S9K6_9BACT